MKPKKIVDFRDEVSSSKDLDDLFQDRKQNDIEISDIEVDYQIVPALENYEEEKEIVVQKVTYDKIAQKDQSFHVPVHIDGINIVGNDTEEVKMVQVGKVNLQLNPRQEKAVQEGDSVEVQKKVVVDKVDIFIMYLVKRNVIVYLENEMIEVEVACRVVLVLVSNFSYHESEVVVDENFLYKMVKVLPDGNLEGNLKNVDRNT